MTNLKLPFCQVRWNFAGMAESHIRRSTNSRLLKPDFLSIQTNSDMKVDCRLWRQESTLWSQVLDSSTIRVVRSEWACITGKLCVIIPNPDCVRSACTQYILSSNYHGISLRWQNDTAPLKRSSYRFASFETRLSVHPKEPHLASIVVCGDERVELCVRKDEGDENSCYSFERKHENWKVPSKDCVEPCNEIQDCDVRWKFAEMVERTTVRTPNWLLLKPEFFHTHL